MTLFHGDFKNRQVDYHHCHADRCDARVDPTMLMCRKHWFMVSRVTRIAVLDTYQPGQCSGNPQPSDAWIAAARRAVDEVRSKERGHVR